MPSNDTRLPWALRPSTRPDAGGGHVSRCAALGMALGARGAVDAIIERSGEGWNDRFRDAGIGVVSESELGDRLWAGVVLDDYDLQPGDVVRWGKRVAGPVVQIVDHQAPLPGIDLAINATPGLTGSKLGGAPALLGAAYAMLAAPYAGRLTPDIATDVRRVLVSPGWVDPRGVTERVLAALGTVAGPKVRVDVMLSSASPNAARVGSIVDARPNWRLHRDVNTPWTLLDGVDIAISAAGQGLLERLAFGIPTLMIAVADNQEPALAGVVAAGAAQSLGRFSELSEDTIAAAYIALAADAAQRSKLSAAAQSLIDGLGASRVARHLIEMSAAPARSAARMSQ